MKLHNFNTRQVNHPVVLTITIIVALVGALCFAGYNAWNDQQAHAGRKISKAKKAKTQSKKRAKTSSQTKVEPNSTEEGYNEDAGIFLQKNTSNLRLAPRGEQGISETYIVATYNILQAESFPMKSRYLGQCPKDTPGDPLCVGKRSDLQAAVITGNADNPAFDIVGTQETSASQHHALRARLPGYGVWPDYTAGDQRIRSVNGGNAIWWNKAKFSLVESGTYKGFNNRAGEADIPWVALRSKNNGKVLYFSSSHYATRRNGGSPAQKKKSAIRTANWVKGKSTAIVVGDFNDKKDRKSTYCVLTSNARLQNAFDSYHNTSPNIKCPSSKTYKGIDHVYTTPNVTTLSWRHLPSTGVYSRASDHTPVYAEVVL